MSPLHLAFDTSGTGGSLALARGDDLLVERDLVEGRRHNVELVATIAAEMARLGFAPSDLAVVHVGVGPGSFTGLRTGCAAAQALALMLPACRFTRVPAVDALRHAEAQAAPGAPVAVSLAWKRDTAYGTVYAGDGAVLLPAAEHPLEAIAAACPAGTRWAGETPPGWVCPPQAVRIPGAGVRAASVLAVGRILAGQGLFVPGRDLLPIYPRRPEAVELWEARHGKPGDLPGKKPI